MSTSLSLFPIPAFNDNYIWCLAQGRSAWVVDPGDAEPVLAHLSTADLNLEGILITHHHWDHTGGIQALSAAYPGLSVIGPDNPAIEGITRRVREGDTFTLDGLALTLKVIALPGHTLDHIGFIGPLMLLCGDTLFSGGCGRLFEGTPAQMQHSLSRLAALPGDTKIYCAHEYTLANLRFAQAVEPDNAALQDYMRQCQGRRQANHPTLPSTIAQERLINPFLRYDEPSVVNSLAQRTQAGLADSVSRFATLRLWKDNFS
ncbi:hydroxyacylglutathione hydrolase [Ferrimonas gelatinilytica]|uniref:Hydroxyacylglutathione hydrolase n=1 Tax=Ferrimonas gelatinilytica TaxID=1255257 RepID=A0ABP9RZH1_9GAMM